MYTHMENRLIIKLWEKFGQAHCKVRVHAKYLKNSCLLIMRKVWFILYHAMYPIACMWVYTAYTVHVSVHCLYCACEYTLPILCMWVYIAYTVHVSVHCLYCACGCTLPILCMWVYIAYTVHVSVHCLYCACECTLPILCMWVYIAYTVHVSDP